MRALVVLGRFSLYVLKHRRLMRYRHLNRSDFLHLSNNYNDLPGSDPTAAATGGSWSEMRVTVPVSWCS